MVHYNMVIYLNNFVAELDKVIFSGCWLSGGEREDGGLVGFDIEVTDAL